LAKTTVITDDLDGSPNAETVRFSLQGRTFEIDLATKSRDKLEKALQPFIDKASAVTGAPRALRLPTNGGSKAKSKPQVSDDRTARRWAQATGLKINGKPVGSKGRLHPDVRAAWHKAGKPNPA
jgi:hypothetical protein